MMNLYVKIRVRYGLSRSSMGKVLGFGVNQWRLYENGTVPSRSHQMLVDIAKSPKRFERLLEVSERSTVEAIGIRKYAKLLSTVRGLCREFDQAEVDRYREWVEGLWV